MYNGIGLQTPRGSGTNGFVTTNLAFIRHRKDKVEYKTDDDLAKLERSLHKQPNKDLMEHQWKRKIELQCIELRDRMEEQLYPEEEIDKEVDGLRDSLLAEGYKDLSTSTMDSHHMAIVNEEKNEKFRNAFGISKDYMGGSAFDPDRQAAKAAEREAKRQEKAAEKEAARLERTAEKEREEKEREKQLKLEKREQRKRKKQQEDEVQKKKKQPKDRSKPKHSSRHHQSDSSDDTSSSEEERKRRRKKHSTVKDKNRRSSRHKSETDSSDDSSSEDDRVKSKQSRERRRGHPSRNRTPSSSEEDRRTRRKRRSYKSSSESVE